MNKEYFIDATSEWDGPVFSYSYDGKEALVT